MELTRRYFLKSTGALAAYVGIAPAAALALPSHTLKLHVRRNKTLVVIFLRGGADGLNLIVPHADPHYRQMRPGIALPNPGTGATAAIDLDGFFGLHPGLGSLSPLFERQLAVAAHAVGYASNTRSHFEEQDTWETGVIGNTVNSDGWLNRHLATSEGHGPIRAVSIGDSLPRILHGNAPAFAVRGVNELTMPNRRGDHATIVGALEHAYRARPEDEQEPARDLLSQTAGTTLDGIEQLRGLAGTSYESAATYPNTPLAQRLREVARLIKAEVGLEVAEVDLGGWDTHAQQGVQGTGQFGQLTTQLGTAVRAFMDDLGDRSDDVLVLTLTDFGRTARENGTGGTDHGWANCMLLLGGPVAKARAADPRPVVTNWPGLAPDQLNQGRDLLHTTDFRDVIAEVVGVHLGNPNLATLLPDHTFKPVGLIA